MKNCMYNNDSANINKVINMNNNKSQCYIQVNKDFFQ